MHELKKKNYELSRDGINKSLDRINNLWDLY